MIKKVSPFDVRYIITMARRFHEESGVKSKFSEKRFKATLLHCMTQGFASMTEDGFMLGIASPSFYSDDVVATEICLYVMPEKRGGMQAARLIKAFVSWADEQRASEIVAGVSVGINDPVADGLYMRLGFAKRGKVYSYPF